MDGRIIVVTGGSRSGKSEFAEQLVLSISERCAYIATAEVLDEEMHLRVEQHKSRRDSKRWLNYEAPFDADKILAQITDEAGSVLFDCITMYLTNLLYGMNAQTFNEQEKKQMMGDAIEKLLDAAKASGKNVVFVTNELGSGIVPFTEMSREFRDLAGQANQMLAKQADEAYLVVSGIPLDLKKLAFNIENRRS